MERAHVGSALSLLTRPFGVPLLGDQPYVERVYELRGAGFDEVLIYAVERLVIKRWLADLFPGRVTETPQSTPPDSHVSERYRGAAAHLGCDMERYEADPVLEITPETRAEAARSLALRGERGERGERVVGIQMGSQRTSVGRLVGARPDLKGLSARQWRALVTRLLDEDHADAIASHGAPGETRMVGAFLRSLPETIRRRCHDLSARVGLDLLPALLASHYALISVDTGPVHIAAAVGCPVLVFFGPTEPAVFRPRGQVDAPRPRLSG